MKQGYALSTFRLCDLTGHVELKTVWPKATGVRIPHPKIEELALQAQGVGIFTFGEYPSSREDSNAPLPTFLIVKILYSV